MSAAGKTTGKALSLKDAFETEHARRELERRAKAEAERRQQEADLEGADFSSFVVPACRRCGGVLKPDVVFFGENVPRDRVDAALRHLDEADAMLVVGSSLMVYSGFRFVERAVSLRKPVAAVNLGRTRADGLLTLKAEEPCESALAFLLRPLSRAASGSIQLAQLNPD